MAQISDIKLPKINTENLDNEKYAKKITNYLLSMEENLRYMFGNLDEDNITDHFVDTLVAKHLHVTNGFNSIMADPETGFKMLKDQKEMLSFNIITGEAYFEGKIISNEGDIGGWEISESGLTSYTTGATINLYNAYNHAMQLSYNGLHLYNHYSGLNEYLGGMIAAYSTATGTNGLVLEHAADAEYLALGFADASDPYSGMPLYLDMIYTRNGYLNYVQGFHFFKPVFINENTVLDSGNYGSYINTNQITPNLTAAGNIDFSGPENAASVTWVSENYSEIGHSHSGYASNSDLSSLESRITALEGA